MHSAFAVSHREADTGRNIVNETLTLTLKDCIEPFDILSIRIFEPLKTTLSLTIIQPLFLVFFPSIMKSIFFLSSVNNLNFKRVTLICFHMTFFWLVDASDRKDHILFWPQYPYKRSYQKVLGFNSIYELSCMWRLNEEKFVISKKTWIWMV